jgi:DNA-binding NtrC family response regulator
MSPMNRRHSQFTEDGAGGIDLQVFEADLLYRRAQSARTLDFVREEQRRAGARTAVELSLIAGMALFDQGQITKGLTQLTAAELDARSFDLSIQFRTTVALFNRCSEFQTPTTLLPFLARLRQITAQKGDTTSLAGLHLATAKLEACRGNCLSAHGHLQTARAFAGRTSAQATLCSIDLVDASLEVIAGNIGRSLSSARSSYDLAVVSASRIQMSASAGMLGLVMLLTGDPSRGKQYLAQALELSEEILYVRLGVLDNLAQVALYEGDLDLCDRYLKDCAAVIAAQDVPARSWYDFAHQVTRCTVLAQFDDWERIIEITGEADPELERRQFRSLRTALLCAAARAYARLGEHAKADAKLGAAIRSCPRGAVDPQIVLEAATAACLTLRGERARGAAHFDRALSAARAIGNRLHEWHIQRDRAACAIARVTHTAPASADAAPAVLSERAIVLSDAATILGAGSSIDLLAHRAISLLQNTPIEPRLHVRSTSGEEFRPEPSVTSQLAADGTFTIDLRGSDRRVLMTVRQVESLDDVAMLRSLLDLLQAAVHRTADTETSADDQNLWPTTLLPTDDEMVFRSPRMAEVLRVAMRLADTELPILITGETGTGKDVIARVIHNHSRQKRGPFVPFNCAAIPKDLLESQLFGHRKGAFTGAVEASTGVIRSAEGGTLFLDEIGELEPSLQPKLLRFLESGEVHAVGDARPARTRVRVLAATNIDLDQRSQSGAFRRDLYFRLGTAQIAMPPLRERKDEIPALTAHFVNRFSRECERPGLRVSDDLIAALLLHDWPGNIRQLANELRRVVAMSEPGQTLTSEDLSESVTQGWRNAHLLATTSSAADDPRTTLRLSLDQPLPRALEELERAFIDRAMHSSGGRVAEAAQLLGISRKGLFLKRRRWGLVDELTE